MPIDVDLSNWNKENAWPAPLIPSFRPEAEMAGGTFDEGEKGENMAEEKGNYPAEGSLRSRKRKRQAVGGKAFIGAEAQQMDLLKICQWLTNQEKKGNVIAFQNASKPFKIVPTPKSAINEEQTRKRVVLGELTEFILSPLRKQYADEAPSAVGIGEQEMDRSQQNGISV